MTRSVIPAFFALALAALAGCSQDRQPSATTTPAATTSAPTTASAPTQSLKPAKTALSSMTNDVAVIKTSAGDLVVEFWPEVAPKTVENFKKLAREGFYDGTASHRLIAGFMVQMGDPLTRDPAAADRWGSGGPGYSIEAEFNERKHERGVLSMARGIDPNSAGSQFFICFAAKPDLDRQYTTFGRVIKGDDALARLEATPCGPGNDGDRSAPLQRVAVESIRIVPGNWFNDPIDVAISGGTRQQLDASTMDLNALAGVLVSLGCPVAKSREMAGQLDKRARQLAERKGSSYDEAVTHLIGLMKQGWSAKERGI